MGAFKIFIETFETKSPNKLAKSFAGFTDNFEVDGVEYGMSISENPDYGIPEILFYVDKPAKIFDNYGLTGSTKNPLKVFSIVANHTRDWIESEHPSQFFFTAWEKERAPLYDRLAELISSKYNYRLDADGSEELKKTMTMDTAPSKVYLFKKG